MGLYVCQGFKREMVGCKASALTSLFSHQPWTNILTGIPEILLFGMEPSEFYLGYQWILLFLRYAAQRAITN